MSSSSSTRGQTLVPVAPSSRTAPLRPVRRGVRRCTASRLHRRSGTYGVAVAGAPIAYVAETEAELDEAKAKASAGGSSPSSTNGAVATPEPAAAPAEAKQPQQARIPARLIDTAGGPGLSHASRRKQRRLNIGQVHTFESAVGGLDAA